MKKKTMHIHIMFNIFLITSVILSIYYNFYIKNNTILIQEDIAKLQLIIKTEQKNIQISQEKIYQLILPERLNLISKKYLDLKYPTLNQIIVNPLIEMSKYKKNENTNK